jgi:hypothetical protein
MTEMIQFFIHLPITQLWREIEDWGTMDLPFFIYTFVFNRIVFGVRELNTNGVDTRYACVAHGDDGKLSR